MFRSGLNVISYAKISPFNIKSVFDDADISLFSMMQIQYGMRGHADLHHKCLLVLGIARLHC